MATINQLSHRVNDLKRDIATIQKQADQRYSQLETEYRQKLNVLEQEMNQALSQSQIDQAKELQANIERINRELARKIQKNYEGLKQELTAEMTEHYQDLLESIQKRGKEWDELIETDIKGALADREEEKIQLSQKEYRAAEKQFHEVNRRPCEFFFPGRQNTFRISLEQAKTMGEQGQYEASTATSIMLTTQMLLFMQEIDRKLEEWLSCFYNLEDAYQKLLAKLTAVLKVEGKQIDEETAMCWTNHRYDRVFAELDRCRCLRERIHCAADIRGSAGVTIQAVEDYLLGGGEEKIRDLEEYLRVLKYELHTLVEQMGEEIRCSYISLLQRREWISKLTQYMKENYNVGEPECNENKVVEERVWVPIWLKYTQPQGPGREHHYICYIVPVMSGLETENHVRIYMDFRQGTDIFQARQYNRMIEQIMKCLGVRKLIIAVGCTKDVLDGERDAVYSLQPSNQNGGEMRLFRHDCKSKDIKGGDNILKKKRQPSRHSGNAVKKSVVQRRREQKMINN